MKQSHGRTQTGATGEVVYQAPGGESQSFQTAAANSNFLTRSLNWLEKYILVLVIGGLFAGIGVASVSQAVVDQVDSIINIFMNAYDLLAPMAIFLILTPSLARLFSTRSMGKFGLFVIRWYAVRKLLASLWAIAFILIVFRIPILPQGSLSLADGITETLKSLGEMATTSTYFLAMYAAIIVSAVSTKVHILTRALEAVMDVVEVAGSYLMPLMPIFMFGIGIHHRRRQLHEHQRDKETTARVRLLTASQSETPIARAKGRGYSSPPHRITKPGPTSDFFELFVKGCLFNPIPGSFA